MKRVIFLMIVFLAPSVMASWTCTPADSIVSGWRARDIYVYDSMNVFLILENMSYKVCYHNGNGWSDMTGPLTGRLYAIGGNTPTDVYVLGTSSDYMSGVIHHWDGANWETTGDLFSGIPTILHVGGPDCVSVAGKYGAISIYNGIDWQLLPNPMVSPLTDIRFYNPADGWIVGGDMQYDPISGYMDTTRIIGHWDGSAWQILQSDEWPLLSLWGLPGGDLYVCSDHEVFSVGPGMELTSMPSAMRADDYPTYRKLFGFSSADLFVIGDKGASDDHALVCRYDGHVFREMEDACGDVEDYYFHIDGGHDRTLCCTGIDTVARWNGVDTHQTGTDLFLPSFVRSGSPFYVFAYLNNMGDPVEYVHVYFALDIYGQYWFWDDWKAFSPDDPYSIDYREMTLPAGTTFLEVIPPFIWPACYGVYYNLFFHGVMLDSSTHQIIGDMSSVKWGFDCN